MLQLTIHVWKFIFFHFHAILFCFYIFLDFVVYPSFIWNCWEVVILFCIIVNWVWGPLRRSPHLLMKTAHIKNSFFLCLLQVVDGILRGDNVDQIAQQAAALFPDAQNDDSVFLEFVSGSVDAFMNSNANMMSMSAFFLFYYIVCLLCVAVFCVFSFGVQSHFFDSPKFQYHVFINWKVAIEIFTFKLNNYFVCVFQTVTRYVRHWWRRSWITPF